MTLRELVTGLIKEYRVHLSEEQTEKFIEQLVDWVIDTYGPPF